jgi:hypothetical protein
MIRCARCPCPEVCLGSEDFCRTASADPQDPMMMRSICDRSRIAAGEPPKPVLEYPSILAQAINATRAAKRVLAAAVQGDPIRVPPETYRDRLALCQSCESYDRIRARCSKCGCTGLKLELATEKCPLDPPRW